MAIKKHGFPERNYTENIENETSNKEANPTFRKSSPIQLLRESIEKNQNTNVQIKIGESTFDCHFVVLQCYSELFRRHSLEKGTIIELPEEQVSSNTFLAIYKWMISNEPLVQRAEVIELLIAACYLEVEQLVIQIWSCLNNDENIPGDAAYFLYLEANILNVDCVRKLMLKRISKFFLILIAFKEFLLMPVNDFCILLDSDVIGVNTEIEVFMAVLRWLSYDWLKRKKHIFNLMKKVRFCLMPPGFLIELDRNMIENVIVKRVMTRPKIRELVNNGLKYATTRLCYGKLIEDNCIVEERHWICDKNCDYHIQKNQLIEYKITYAKFQQYLAFLQKREQHYWQNFIDIKTEVSSPARSSGKCQMQISEIMKETTYACIVKEIPKTIIDSSRYKKESTSNITAQQTLTDSQDIVVLSAKDPSYTVSQKYVIQSTIRKFQNDSSQTSHQPESESENLFEIHDLNSYTNLQNNLLESPRFGSRAFHYTRQSSSCSSSTLDSIDSSISRNKNKTVTRKQKKSQNDSSPQRKEVSQSLDNNDTNSFISMLSLDRLSRSYTSESGSLIMSVKSTSKKSISIESFKKNSNKKELRNRSTGRQPHITAQRQKFQIKDIQFEEIFSNLSISSKGTSSQLSSSETTSESIKKLPNEVEENESNEVEKNESNEVENNEILPNDGAGDDSILQPAINSHDTLESARKVLFKNKTLLIMGGSDPYQQNSRKHIDLNDRILFYSYRFKNWAHLPHTSFGTRQHHEAVICNGLVYIIGGTKVIPGCKKTFFETSIWALNNQTKKWTFETNLPRNRRDFAVVAIGDELNEPGFFVIGGESFDRVPLDSVWFYNILRKVWLRKASLNTPRYGFSATIVKNEIWIAGGIACSPNITSAENGNDLSARRNAEFLTDTIETFNLENALNKNRGKWLESKCRLRQRCLFGKLVTTRDNKVFLIGGIGNNSNDTLQSFDAIDRFDFQTEKWMECAKLQIGRHGHDVVLIDDYIAIIGGVSSTQKRALPSIEFFCTKTLQVFNPIPDLPRSLSGLAAVVVEGQW